MERRLRVKLLDLYCGHGLAAWGYWLSGCFSEIVGVDNCNMADSYAFDFIQADVLTLDYEFLMQFDFIHASPPCQAYSKLTPDSTAHPKLIKPTQLMLAAAGKPCVIENVEGSQTELRPNLHLRGYEVGLPMSRVRYFQVSGRHVANLRKMIVDHSSHPGRTIRVHDREKYVTRSLLIEAFGLDCIPEKRLRNLSIQGIEQGIPPMFTKRIAETFIGTKFMVG